MQIENIIINAFPNQIFSQRIKLSSIIIVIRIENKGCFSHARNCAELKTSFIKPVYKYYVICAFSEFAIS